MGLRFKENSSILYVADAFNGIFKIDVLNGNIFVVMKISQDGKYTVYLNGICHYTCHIIVRNYIYFASDRFPLNLNKFEYI